MEKQHFYNKCKFFEDKIAGYSGDDPLECYYDFVMWLENNEGRQHFPETYAQVLQQSLLAIGSDQRYMQDHRFIQLIILHINILSDKLSPFENLIQQDIGTKCSILFDAWAKQLVNLSRFNEAENIIKKGFELGAEPSSILADAYSNLLVEVGRHVLLNQEMNCEISGIHCSCHKLKTDCNHSQQTSIFQVVNWEWLPLKPGEIDNFIVPLTIPDPPDPNKIPIYPKNLIYLGDTEIQLEEVIAHRYLEKFSNLKNVSTKPFKEGTNMEVEEINPVAESLHIQQGDLSQSFTATTKVALNIVQEMWSSPTPTVGVKQSLPKVGMDVFKVPDPPKSMCEVGLSAPTPFTVFKDASALMDDKTQALCTKSSALQSVSKGGLSLRTNQPSKEVERVSAKQLMFDNSATGSSTGLSDEVLAQQLEPKQPLSNPSCLPVPPISQIPSDWMDSDFTCNTNAFNNFPFLASTPNFKMKMEQPSSAVSLESGEVGRRKSGGGGGGPNTSLSVILEASKERGSTLSTQVSPFANPHGHAIQNKSPSTCEIDSDFCGIKLDSVIDPFSIELRQVFLSKLNFPNNLDPGIIGGYFPHDTCSPSFDNNSILLGNEIYSFSDKPFTIGNTHLYKAKCSDRLVSLKVSSPNSFWEYYISKEVLRRVGSNFVSYFMDIKNAYIFKNCTVFETCWAQYGSLSKVVNTYKKVTGNSLLINISIHFCIEVLKIINTLHNKCNIIHGDIKPDNFLVFSIPYLDDNVPISVQLIDFSNAIDMKLLPKGFKFNQVINNNGFLCNAMKESKPWNYQIDLYGLAGTIYFLLVGNPLKVQLKKNVWSIQKNLPREMNHEIWNPIFTQLLNVESCESLPDLEQMVSTLESHLQTLDPLYTRKSFLSLSDIFIKNQRL